MKCKQAQELLSAYYDEELSHETSSNVDGHLAECSTCAWGLAGFEKLSEMGNAFNTPEPPEQIWHEIEQQLAHPAEDECQVREPQSWLFFTPKLLALAATLLIAAGIGWFSYRSRIADHHHDNFTLEFAHYLEEFRRDPAAAQRILHAKYEIHPVVPDQAIKRIGYRPAIANGLPKGYTIVSTHVMKMPCCDCMQSICKRSDGSTLVIFEHGGDSCTDHECCLVELNDQIATTWKRGKRHMTLVGVRDASEVNQLVTWMDRQVK